MPHALILMPARAEVYSYHPIVARFDVAAVDNPVLMMTRPTNDASALQQMLDEAAEGRPPACDHFFWGYDHQLVDASRITEWVVARVQADEQDRLRYLVDYQVARLWSGLHPSYSCYGVSTGNEVAA